jgi:hypothetical protein
VLCIVCERALIVIIIAAAGSIMKQKKQVLLSNHNRITVLTMVAGSTHQGKSKGKATSSNAMLMCATRHGVLNMTQFTSHWLGGWRADKSFSWTKSSFAKQSITGGRGRIRSY